MRRGKFVFSTLSILLVFSMLFFNFQTFSTKADIEVEGEVDVTYAAKSKSSTESKKRIAMVMDNSGSMYEKGVKRWSQVKYAMEVFASMLNEGDELYIFPMHNATVGKNGGQTYNQNNPLLISKDNLDDIHNIYSVGKNGDLGGTPFSTVIAANKFLKDTKEAGNVENWLVILADGEFTVPSKKRKNKYIYDTARRNAPKETRKKDAEKEAEIKKMASNVNVEYLIFNDEKSKSGGQTDVKEGQYHRTYAADNSDSIIQSLITSCNNIFKRDYFENVTGDGNGIDGENLNFDVSMKKIFIMAQSKNAKIKGIGGETTKETKKFTTSDVDTSRECVDGKSARENGVETDNSLGGVMAVFKDVKVPDGNSAKVLADGINISDNKKCFITYEVDADMNIILTSTKTGDKVKLPNDSLPEGEYKVEIGIYDQQNGHRLDKGKHKSDLIGDFHIDKAEINVGGEDIDIQHMNGKSIKIKGFGAKGHIDVVGHYGNKIKYYVNTMADDTKAKWKFTTAKKVGLKLERKAKYYTLSGIEEGEGIIAHLSLNDENLSDEALSDMEVQVKSDKVLGYETIPMKGKSAYRIKFRGKDDKGRITEKGTHDLKVRAVQKSTSAKSKVKEETITITTLPIWLYWLIGFLILLLLLALAAFILTRKAGPKTIVSDRKKESYTYTKGRDKYEASSAGKIRYSKDGRLDIVTADNPDDFDSTATMRMTLEPVKMRKDRRSKRDMNIVGMSLSDNITSASIGGMRIDKNSGRRGEEPEFYCGNTKLDEVFANKNARHIIKDGSNVDITAMTEDRGVVNYRTKLRFK